MGAGRPGAGQRRGLGLLTPAALRVRRCPAAARAQAQQKNCLPRISPSKSSPTRQLKGSQDTLGRANSRDTLPGIGKTHALQLRTKRSIVDLPHRTGHEDKHGEDHFKTGELVPQVRSNSLGVQHYRPGHEHKHAQDHFQKGFEMLPKSESANVDELNILAPHYGHGWEKKGTEDHMKTGAGVMIVPTEGEEVMPGGVRKVHIEPKLASDFVPFASTDEDFLHRSPPADFYQKRRVKRTAAVPGLPVCHWLCLSLAHGPRTDRARSVCASFAGARALATLRGRCSRPLQLVERAHAHM